MIPFLEEAKKINETIVADRRHLHQCPEIGLELPKTKEYVMKRLRELGLEPQEIGKSSLVALVGGKKPGKVFLLRADMDALPIVEETGHPFASANGNMHACGHDTHAAMLLGAAKILKDHEEELEGTVKLFFQSAEEVLLGAKESVDAGLLENPKVDAAMMVHIASALPGVTSTMGIPSPGSVFASADWYRIDIQGKGGHGSMPEAGISPINIACAINTAIQEIKAYAVPSKDRAVISVGEFHSGNAGNIIPDTAYMVGTIRTFDEGVRTLIKDKLVQMAEGSAACRGGSAKVTFFQGCPSNQNDPALRQMALDFLPQLLGEQGVADLEQVAGGVFARVSGSEDFAYISQEVPSLVGLLFAGSVEEGYAYSSHHPKSDFKEADFYIGSASYAAFADEWLRRNR